MQEGAQTSKRKLTSLSATEMASAVRTREISPVSLVDAHLERISKLNPQLNAFVHVDFDGARQQAKTAEAALDSSAPLGPLHGVPISIKSSIDVAGWPCACGSRLRVNYVPENDAPLVSRLRSAGAILLGNTNAPEFLMAYETDNRLKGRSNNPWDLRRTPGGSSGGEAAAIAARCSAGGVGSDGGGSIRVPAHYSGICGLKPTPGRIPATGHFPESAGPFASMGVVGPMARTINDVKMLFEVMAGPDDGDPMSAPVPLHPPSEKSLQQLHIGFFEDDGRIPVTRETRAAVQCAAGCLQAKGYFVEEFVPDELELVRRIWWNLFGRAGQVALGSLYEGKEGELSPILKEFIGIVRAEPLLTLEEFMNTLIERDAVRTRFLRQMEKYPILICPVCAVPAFTHGERKWEIGGRTVEYLEAMSYCQWFNALGNPAAVVPVGRSPEGLPIGVQVIGRPYEDEAVLAIAQEIESSCGDLEEPPPLQ
ncbi:MAG TPA: amidase [Candidatus Acidoferrales bacterium]|nr:amidase [Candidatus Acidoferrales bacterium]